MPQRRCNAVLALTLTMALVAAQARPTRPPPQPSPSTIAPGSSQTPQLPSGADTGIPGTGQKPIYSGNVKGDNTPRKVLRRRGAEPAASGVIGDDRAAARAASRSAAPASRAGSTPR
ncbi:MAG: hypothetical protein ABIX46_00385 [Burkholderiaceae bacterium]